MQTNEQKRQHEEEFVAVVVALAAMIALLFYLLRGCGKQGALAALPPTQDAVRPTSSANTTSDMSVSVGENTNSVGVLPVGDSLAAGVVTVLPTINAQVSPEIIKPTGPTPTKSGVDSVTATMTASALGATETPVSVITETPLVVPSLTVVATLAPADFTLTLPTSEWVAGGQYNLEGMASPNSQMRLSVNGAALGTATVASDGTWSLPVLLPNAPGDYQLSAELLNPDGSVASVAAPVSLQLLPAALAVKPFDLPTPAASDAPVNIRLQGVAAPGAQLQALLDGNAMQTVTVPPDGNWQTELSLAAGEHTVEVRDLTGGSAPFSQTLMVTMPSEPVTATVIAPTETVAAPTEALVGATEAPSAVPTVPATVTSAPAAPTETPTAAGTTDFAIESATSESGQIVLSGRAAPNTGVDIFDNDQLVGRTVAAANGIWRYVYAASPGQHFIAALQTGSTQKITSPAPVVVAFPVATLAAGVTPTPYVDLYPCDSQKGDYGYRSGRYWIVGRCNTLTNIAQQIGVDVRRLIAINPQIANPNIIYLGQAILLP